MVEIYLSLVSILQEMKDLKKSIKSNCKVVSYGRNISFVSQYITGNERLEKVDKTKDLGVTFDKSLKL